MAVDPRMGVKDRRVIRDLLAGRDITDPTRRAQLYAILKKPAVKPTLEKAFRDEGIDEATLARNFAALTQANSTLFFLNQKNDTLHQRTIEDNSVRLQANKAIATLMDLEPSKKLEVRSATGDALREYLSGLTDDELLAILYADEPSGDDGGEAGTDEGSSARIG